MSEKKRNERRIFSFTRVVLHHLFFISVMITPWLLHAQSDIYRVVPLNDKVLDKDLTFCVTFDNRFSKADFAKGDPNSTTLPNLALGIRGIIGFDNQQAFQPQGEEDLRYNVAGNILPHCGTVTLWICGLNYNPMDEMTDGKKRGNICLLHLMFKQANRNVNYQLYEYGSTVYFDWRNSEEPQSWGSVGRVQVPRYGIKRNQWHQIAVTYDERKLAMYLNGKLISEDFLPEKVATTLDLKPDDSSFLGIKSRFYEDKHQWGVAVDDVKVYSRVLTPMEIYNQYQKLLLNQTAAKIQSFGVKLNGVDEGEGRTIDQLEAEFDFSVLPDEEKKQMDAGKLQISYNLSGPENFSSAGTWTMQQLSECRRIGGISKPGKYTLEAILKYSTGKIEKNTADIDVPDLSFANNGIGDEDKVPKIWSSFSVKENHTDTLWDRVCSLWSDSAEDGNRTVTLWNRVYSFGAGPLPTAITSYGKPLLQKPPELVIETASGKADIQYSVGETKRTKSAVVFTGIGMAVGFTVDYATTVEFDGFIKFDFVIKGQPEIKSMHLDWQVKPELCQFLMTPLLQEDEGTEFAFKFPVGDITTETEIWLVSEGKGGFAYAMANDANWIYDPTLPVFKVNKATGTCSVSMITRTVKLPEATPYQALFIATPTRPLPERNRVIRFGDSTRYDTPRLSMCAGEGIIGGGTFKPHPTSFAQLMKDRLPQSIGVYGMADSLTTGVPIANYFKKYWDIPGYCVYPMTYMDILPDGKVEKTTYFTVPACDATHIKDYLLGNIKELLQHPLGDRIWMIYYDLCGDVQCANKLHGCGFQDKFGRDIKTFSILHKRKLVERTVRFCHASGRVVMLHNQRYFYPFIHGMSDYWYPGEQHGGLLIRNPYGYTDELSDNIYRSEYNRNVLGVGVIFLTALGQANVEYLNNDAYTEAMWTMLLSHDVEPDAAYTAVAPNTKVWNILEKYQVQAPSVKCNRYYEQNSVFSSDPEVRVTYYECPEKKYVMVLANKDLRPRETVIDLNKLQAGSYAACEEYTGTNIQVEDGKFSITVPPRSFRLVAFPPRPFYPVFDDCSQRWGSWKTEGAKVDFNIDRDIGRKEKGSLMMQVYADTPPKSAFCFMKKFLAKPGNTYTARIFVKTKDVSDGAKVSLTFQCSGSDGKFLGLPVQTTSLTSPIADWQELILKFTVPQTGKWAKTSYLLVTLVPDSIKEGTIWFDDFEMSEFEQNL